MVQVKTITIEVVLPNITLPKEIEDKLRGSEEQRLAQLNELARKRGEEAKDEGKHKKAKERYDGLILALLHRPENKALIENNPVLRRELLNQEHPESGYSITIGGRRVTNKRATILVPEEKMKGNLDHAMAALAKAIEKAKAEGKEPTLDLESLKKPDRDLVTEALLAPENADILSGLVDEHRVVTVYRISFARTPSDAPEEATKASTGNEPQVQTAGQDDSVKAQAEEVQGQQQGQSQ